MRYGIMSLIIVSLLGCERAPHHFALGTLERQRIAHTATTNEIIVALPVAQGSPVVKGTILVQLDDRQQKAQVAKARANVAQAKAYLKKLQQGPREQEIAAAKANVNGAEAILVESDANYKRVKSLAKQKLISKADLDQALAARDSALASLNSVRQELRLLAAGTRKEDLEMAQASVDAFIAMLAIEKEKLADLTIRATRDGILDNLPWNLGERVTAGSPLAVLLAGQAPFARVYIPEPYRVKLKINDKLQVHVDGVKDIITGYLRWIAIEPAFTPYYALNQAERSRLMYLAEVQLPDSEAYLPSGVAAQVELP